MAINRESCERYIRDEAQCAGLRVRVDMPELLRMDEKELNAIGFAHRLPGSCEMIRASLYGRLRHYTLPR